MLHCNMANRASLPLHLDDLLGDLRHARRGSDLARLALVSYCEVRRWAREAGEQQIAKHSSDLFIAGPHESREAFLRQVDDLILELEEARLRFDAGNVQGPQLS